MLQINYHHLYYYWAIIREGGVGRAASKLRVSQPALSSQLRRLEENLGAALVSREGKKLIMTDTGHLVFGYADDIFKTGEDLIHALAHGISKRRPRLVVGITDVLPKMAAFALLNKAMAIPQGVVLSCHEDQIDQLLLRLNRHELDVVLSDTRIPPGFATSLHAHELFTSHVTIMGRRDLVRKYIKKFPQSLDGAPFLLPLPGIELRHQLDEWFAKNGIAPVVVGEFEDSALLKAFGREGAGFFCVPSLFEKAISEQYQAVVVGRMSSITEKYYAITATRKFTHPALTALIKGKLKQ